jgi:hypothetical protein
MAKALGLEDLMKFTPQAKKQWEKIPKEVRVKLLNNVYCSRCKTMTGIAEIEGTVNHGDLILHGKCTACGSEVARLIETAELPDPT